MSHLHRFLIFFLLIASIFCMTVSACGPEFPFDPSEPYYEITPTAVHTILADELQTSGHIGTSASDYFNLYSSYEDFKKVYLDPLIQECFRIDTHYKDQPSLREQWDSYTESFFENHVLLVWESESGYAESTGDAFPAPELKHIYLQEDRIWIASRLLRTGEKRLKEPNELRDSIFCEHHTFIEIKREEFEKLNIDPVNFRASVSMASKEYYANPNTGDTSLRSLMLPLIAISLVSASVVWCGKKRKRA